MERKFSYFNEFKESDKSLIYEHKSHCCWLCDYAQEVAVSNNLF